MAENKTRMATFWRVSRVVGLFVRELVGWALMLVSLNIFRICFRYLNQGYVIEGFVTSIIGVMVFRGGLQLVKVAVAARALRNTEPIAVQVSKANKDAFLSAR